MNSWKGILNRAEILNKQRVAYLAEILQTLSAKLAVEFGRGFSQLTLASMVRFAVAFPDREIVATLSQQLSWSHFVQIIYLDDPLKRKLFEKHWQGFITVPAYDIAEKS